MSYTRFVALIPRMMIPMLAYLQSRYGACTSISFIGTTSLQVCDPKRTSGHRVFAVDARTLIPGTRTALAGEGGSGMFFEAYIATDDGELRV